MSKSRINSTSVYAYRPFSFLLWNWARIRECVDFRHVKITDTNHVNFHAWFEVCTSHVAIKDHISFTRFVHFDLVGICHILMSIDEYIRMRVAPNQWSILLIVIAREKSEHMSKCVCESGKKSLVHTLTREMKRVSCLTSFLRYLPLMTPLK